MVTRLLSCTVRPGRMEEARRIFEETGHKILQQFPGCLALQIMESDHDIVGFTNWQTPAELQAYVDSDLVREHYARLAALLMGTPSVKTYRVTFHSPRPGP